MQQAATSGNNLQPQAASCNKLQQAATCGNKRRQDATSCNKLQQAATTHLGIPPPHAAVDIRPAVLAHRLSSRADPSQSVSLRVNPCHSESIRVAPSQSVSLRVDPNGDSVPSCLLVTQSESQSELLSESQSPSRAAYNALLPAPESPCQSWCDLRIFRF